MAASASFAKDQLRSIVERIERLEEEKQALADDIKEVYAEAKGNGFDTKTLRQVVRLRKQDMAERQEREALLDLYMHALGMVAAGGGGGVDGKELADRGDRAARPSGRPSSGCSTSGPEKRSVRRPA